MERALRLYRIICGLVAAASVFLPGGVPAHADAHLHIGGTGASYEYSRIMARGFIAQNPGTEIKVHTDLGSGGGIRAVIAGALQLAFSDRPVTDAEANQGVVAIEILKTPFGFFTSRRQPVCVEPAEIVHLYEHPGCDCHWFGGEPLSIVLRPQSDSDMVLASQYFEGFAESIADARLRDGIPVAQTDQENAKLAEKLKNSLTTGTLLQMTSERRDLRPLLINEVAPTLETMRSGAYPYIKIIYLIHREHPADVVRSLTAYLHSDQAVEITRRIGAEVIR
jgi:phosphate transport system substrate-binding protein